MKVLVFLLSVVLAGLLLVQPANCAQCTPDKDNPCKSMCNGTTFDISNIFDFPVNVSDPARGYWYLWSPCDGFECPESSRPSGKNCAVCQKADQFYNCGHTTDPIWIFNYNFNLDEMMFQIQYPWGTSWRMTEFTFLVDKKQEKTTVEFVGEDPYLQYNFLVRGRCVGQPDWDGSCKKAYKHY